MAQTEIIHTGSPLSASQPNMPPNSSNQPSSEHTFISNNVQQFIDMVNFIVATQIASPPIPMHTCFTPPNSPDPLGSAQSITMDRLEQLLNDLIEAKSPVKAPMPETDVSGSPTPDEVNPSTRKLHYKKVNEVWDEKEYKYKIVEALQVPDKADEPDQCVFVVRGRIDKKTTDTTVFVDIKSTHLRDMLRNVLKDARTINTKGNNLSVEQNFLYHYLAELESCQSWNSIDPLDQKSVEQVGLLVDYMKASYKDTTQDLASLLKNNEITYELLWALFKPNDPVFTTCHGTHKPRCVRYGFGEEKISPSGSKYWNIECRYQDFDGRVFGEVPIELQIPKFRGVKRIDLLEAFPLRYHLDSSQIKDDLIQRGRKFVSLIGSHHRQYQGTAFFMLKGQPIEVFVDGRVMIDAAALRKFNPNYSRQKIIEPADAIPVVDIWDLSFSLDDPAGFSGKTEVSLNLPESNTTPSEMTEKDFLICCPTVPGFSFANSLWAEFAVDNIEDIRWSSEPFDCLVIPKEDREIIMALVEARNRRGPGESDFGFDDIVTGKGRGLNVLLHGDPGLGKTLTAEAAAEKLKRPLYSISAGDLGMNAAELEARLSEIFQIASHWGAILLLDEADVYLERRSNQDLARNALVSVFLRKLEYCEGIIFLTTNRVAQFDEAILSRIHLTLKYVVLDKETKRKIWKQTLDRARTSQGHHRISPKELAGLTSAELNGRQINNAVATAHALAMKNALPIQIEHVRTAVAIHERFAREFYGKDKVDGMYH